MTRREKASIYRRAARLVEDEIADYACEAIGQVLCLISFAYIEDHPALQMFTPPRLSTGGGFWHGRTGRDARVLALCFMAAMVETGDA